MIVLLVLGVLCILLSIIFFFGKGKYLIAGYNTSSKEEQSKYDEKKLNLIMAIGMLLIGILLLLMFFYINVLPEWFIWIFVALFIIISILICVFANTICKKEC